MFAIYQQNFSLYSTQITQITHLCHKRASNAETTLYLNSLPDQSAHANNTALGKSSNMHFKPFLLFFFYHFHNSLSRLQYLCLVESVQGIFIWLYISKEFIYVKPGWKFHIFSKRYFAPWSSGKDNFRVRSNRAAFLAEEKIKICLPILSHSV